MDRPRAAIMQYISLLIRYVLHAGHGVSPWLCQALVILTTLYIQLSLHNIFIELLNEYIMHHITVNDPMHTPRTSQATQAQTHISFFFSIYHLFRPYQILSSLVFYFLSKQMMFGGKPWELTIWPNKFCPVNLTESTCWISSRGRIQRGTYCWSRISMHNAVHKHEDWEWRAEGMRTSHDVSMNLTLILPSIPTKAVAVPTAIRFIACNTKTWHHTISQDGDGNYSTLYYKQKDNNWPFEEMLSMMHVRF